MTVRGNRSWNLQCLSAAASPHLRQPAISIAADAQRRAATPEILVQFSPLPGATLSVDRFRPAPLAASYLMATDEAGPAATGRANRPIYSLRGKKERT
jgi:hypothetical protein